MAEVEIVTVAIGNPGNAPDTRYATPGIGGVDYIYEIGKFEITAGQYCTFLNAVAASDPYELYSTSMDTTINAYGCNILRSGLYGSYTYSVAPDWANRPVNFVSWGDAARFCNWLQNGQPTGTLTGFPALDAALTEDGSYYIDGRMTDEAWLAVTRKPGTTWVIPTENEGYKAALHKNDGPSGNYYCYPTQSDEPPVAEPPPGRSEPPGSANCDWAVGAPYYRNEVGAYANSPSPYGTFDQGGNVWEWNEAIVLSPYRGLQGGCFNYEVENLHASHREFGGGGTIEGYYGIGFRVAKVNAVTELCDVLGKSHGLDTDLYIFQGGTGEQVTIALAAGSAWGNNRATLVVTNIGLAHPHCWVYRMDCGVLPNEVVLTLPCDGCYLVIVAEQPRGYRGPYCVTLDSSSNAQSTFDRWSPGACSDRGGDKGMEDKALQSPSELARIENSPVLKIEYAKELDRDGDGDVDAADIGAMLMQAAKRE
jgi:formylglycine-generating enzyme required for sulfatase activity